MIATAAKTYGSEAVLVSSFTKTAARELVSRNLPLADHQVGTLHALCYRALDSPRVATGSILKEWNAQYPYCAFEGFSQDLDDPYGDSPGEGIADDLLQEMGKYRGLQIDEEGWPERLKAFAKNWGDFKANTGTIDFTDMIDTCVKEHVGIPHQAEAFFLDEVQDFSPLELALARRWGSECRDLYLVGDSDQCLYRFKGCRADAFLNPPLPAGQIRVLEQSYRVPAAVHAAAVKWVEQIEARMPAAYRPRDAVGVVDTLPISYKAPIQIQPFLEEWLAHGKTVAILASCSYMLEPTIRCLRQWGLPFHNPYRKKRGDWNPLARRTGAVSSAERLLAFLQLHTSGAWWTYDQLWRWAAYLESETVFTRGAKTEIRKKADSGPNVLVEATDLERWIPAEADVHEIVGGSLPWLRQHLLESKQHSMSYACAVYETHGLEALAKSPQITIGTIHSMKGGEASVVILYPDLSQSGYTEWMSPGEGRDSVIRTFYVGMTRAKEALYWGQPVGTSIGGYL